LTPACCIDPESPLGKLPRPSIAELPLPRKGNAVFTNEKTEETYLKIYRGDCIFVWKHFYKDCRMLALGLPSFQISVRMPDAKEIMELNSNALFHTSENYSFSNFLNTPGVLKYLSDMSRNQFCALCDRVMHIFIRVVGIEVGFRSIRLIWSGLLFGFRGWWSEQLDLNLVTTDIAVQSNQPVDDIYHWFRHLGRALETCKRLDLAAEIYSQVGRDYSVDLEAGLPLIHRQGYLYVVLGRYDDAEYVYLYALGMLFAHGGDQVIESVRFQDILSDLLVACQLNANLASKSPTSSATVEGSKFILLNTCHQVASSKPAPNLKVLAPKYRKVNSAKAALLTALKTASSQCTREASIKSLHSSLQGWLQPGTAITSPIPDVLSKVTSPDAIKRFVRQNLQDEPENLCAGLVCGRWECTMMGHKDKVCGKCKDTSYCSQECQLTDWPSHKGRCKLVAKAKLKWAKS
jgi:cytochrome c551/c552